MEKKNITIGLKPLLTLLCSLQLSFVFAQTGNEIYATYCSGCHGSQLQGTAAGSALIKTDWKFGGDKTSLIKTISDGIPGTTMVAWRNTLSEDEIASLADYIADAQKSPKSVKTAERPSTIKSKHYNLKVEMVIDSGLDGAWGIEFVDDRHAYVTGNKGQLYYISNGKLDATRIEGLPKVYGVDLVGGMMDLALDPDYKNNGWIYIGFSHNPANSTDPKTAGMTKIVRGKVRDHKWVDEQTLFQAHDSILVTGGMRWGCRLFFDKEGYLYFTIGDMQASKQSGNNPQLLHRAEGKIFRVHPDGSLPKDNPFYDSVGGLQAIYSRGTRNVQGLAQHPISGKIYFTDHGPKGGDELNILKKGANYGWPLITYGVNYDGSIVSSKTHMRGMEQPLVHWTPSIAVCAAEFVTGNKFPKWQNNLLITALKSEELRLLVIEDEKVLEQEIILKGYGRVRDVKFAPNGNLYVLTNSPDALLRIVVE